MIGTAHPFGLFPALRVGYLGVPPDLVPRFSWLRSAMDIFPAPLVQSALAELITEGHFARHLRRMRALYAERRRVLVSSLENELGERVRVIGERAGMHLVALLPPGTEDHEVAVRAARLGISAAPLSSCYEGRKKTAGLVLGFGSTRPRDIPDAVRALKSALRG